MKRSLVLALPLLALACASGPDTLAVVQSQGMAANGMLAELQARIEADPRLLTARGGDGGTLLHRAAEKGQLAILDYLLTKGMAIDEKDNQGWTPLAIAVKRKQPAAVRHLIEKGADRNATDENGFSIGTNAFLTKDQAVIEVLKEFGVEVNVPQL